MVERLEAAFCTLVGTRHAIATSSGTTALVAAIEALRLEPGDEVLTSPFTFVATLNAILEAGATATFVDVGDDFTIDAALVDASISPRTRVLLPVHLYGASADLPALSGIAARRELALVEDAAQALGATVAGRPVGSFGIAGCFSLYATKNVTTGEGGVITSNDDAVAHRIRLLRNQGARARYEYEIPGHNFRMTELEAAIGVPQMNRLRVTTQRRRRNAEFLGLACEDLPGVVVPRVVPGREHVWHQFTVRITEHARRNRDEVAAALSSRGIATGVYYPRVVFDYACYRDHPRVRTSSVPVAELMTRQVLSLPVHPSLGSDDLCRIGDAMRELLG
jgi:dTDP-4-amino-4,6-dideoxygalactose transaminase